MHTSQIPPPYSPNIPPIPSAHDHAAACLHIVITRPQPQAAHWQQVLAEQLRAPRYQIHTLPCMAIQPLPDPACQQRLVQAWQALDRYAAIFFVSPAAVQHFFAATDHALLRWQQQPALRAWAPGGGTRQALIQLGVEAARIDSPPAHAAQADSEHLWPLVQPQLARARQQRLAVLRVRGTDAAASDLATACATAGHGRDWLAQQLEQAGLAVHTVVAYRRCAPEWNSATQQQALGWVRPDALWLWSSAQALTHACALLPQARWAQARALATHPRIAAAAQQAGFLKVCTCPPSLPAIVQSIQCHA